MSVLLRSALKPDAITTEIEERFNPIWEKGPISEDIAKDISVVITKGDLGLKSDEMRALPNLKLISVYGVGTDAIDLVQAKERGIQVATTPNVLTNAVAEMALALTLAGARRIAEGDRHVRAGKWPQSSLGLGWSVNGETAGIFGYGRIGKRLAELCRAVGMQVLYTDLQATPGEEAAFRPSAEELARDCRVLIISAEGGEKTRGLINRKVLKALGPDGLLVNIARGSVINEAELIETLAADEIACAALDVFEDEPNVPEALRNNPKLVLTPHVASGTVDARIAMGRLVIDNTAAFLAGEPLLTPLSF